MREERVSRVNLFYTQGSLQAAYLHPARAHRLRRAGVFGGAESHCKSCLTRNISHIIGNITGAADETQQKQAGGRWGGLILLQQSRVIDFQMHVGLHSSIEGAPPAPRRRRSEWWLNTGNAESRETLSRVIAANGLGALWLRDGEAANENNGYNYRSGSPRSNPHQRMGAALT